MVNRPFFQLLTGFAIPRPRWPTEHCPEAAEPVLQPTSLLHANDAPTPDWLAAWLRLPRLPVIADDLPQILDPHECDLAALILERIRSGSPIDLHYFGGAAPGKPRQVLPVLLFTTALNALGSGAVDPNPLYLLAWCQARNAPRTFRLDRMQVDSLKLNSLAPPFPLLPSSYF